MGSQSAAYGHAVELQEQYQLLPWLRFILIPLQIAPRTIQQLGCFSLGNIIASDRKSVV